MVKAGRLGLGGPDHALWSREALAALVAQLHYDRADVARLSSAAAAAMDIVISEVTDAAESLLSARQEAPFNSDRA